MDALAAYSSSDSEDQEETGQPSKETERDIPDYSTPALCVKTSARLTPGLSRDPHKHLHTRSSAFTPLVAPEPFSSMSSISEVKYSSSEGRGLAGGGYVSKRKRAHADLELQGPAEGTANSEGVKAYLRTDSLVGGGGGGGHEEGRGERELGGGRGVEATVRDKVKRGRIGNKASRSAVHSFTEHSKPVLHLSWHTTDTRLLLSSSLDGMVKLWDASPHGRVCIATWSGLHGGPVWDAVWISNNTILTGGADSTARWTDVETSQTKLKLQHKGIVTVTRHHPESENLVLTGDSNSHIQSWDLRSSGDKPVAQYVGAGGKILDIEFLREGKEFAASASIVRRNAANQALAVWDLESTIVLSNQIYAEPYTCTCLRAHPQDATFLAQSHGNYIVMFSSNRPYRLNKYKRFEGHVVEGFAVGFDISRDGTVVCSASASGEACFYDYHSSRLLRRLGISQSACLSVAWNRDLPSTVALSDWNGDIHFLQ